MGSNNSRYSRTKSNGSKNRFIIISISFLCALSSIYSYSIYSSLSDDLLNDKASIIQIVLCKKV